MKQYWLSAVLLAVPALCFTGCSKEPSAVGIKLFPSSEKFAAHETTYAAIADTMFTASAVNGNGYNALVGNQSSVDCKALLRFTVTIPESLTTVKIDTARLSLTVNYSWNTSRPTPSASYDIKEVLTPWSAASVTIDSLNGLSLAATNSTPITVTSQDTFTVGKILTSQIDTSLVRKWITISADTVDTLTARFFSIAVITHPGLTNTGIWGFTGFGTSTPPSLVVIYEKNGVTDSVTLNVGETTFLATGPPLPSSNYLEVQGGISVRSRIRFSMKPVSDSANKAIINNATMQLTLDNSARILGLGSADSLIAYFGGNDSRLDSVISSNYVYGYRQDTTSTANSVYVFSVTSMAQQWLNSPPNNFGVVIRAINDIGAVDRHVFYSLKDTARAPRILVTYTKR